MHTLAILILAACSTQAPQDSTTSLGLEVQPDSTLPPPTYVSLSGPSYVMVDAPYTLDLTGGLPAEDVYLVIGPRPGEGPCHRMIGGYCLEMARPVALATTDVTDGSGNLTIDRTGASWPGARYCYQAVIVRGPIGLATALSDVVCVDFCAAVDTDADGVCDTYDVCPGFDDALELLARHAVNVVARRL